MERELKYSGENAAAFEALHTALELGGFAAGPGDLGAFTDVYLDTADRRILAAGYACRLRRKGDTWLATLKGLSGATGALHEREEVESAAAPSANPQDWPAGPARDLALELTAGASLDELFTLRQARTKRMLGPAGAPVAELSLDEVIVEIEGATAGRYREVEAEQVAGGTPEDLVRIESALAGLGLSPEPLSKFERALLLRPSPDSGLPDSGLPDSGLPDSRLPDSELPTPDSGLPALPALKSPGVVPEDVLSEAARKVLRFHFARMRLYEEGARAGEDAEDLHRMRVATRRMRVALKLFGGAFKPKALRSAAAGLRATGRALGAVRDLDVLLDHLREYRKDSGERKDLLAPLVSEWEAERERLRGDLLTHLDDDYRRFVARFSVFLDTPGAGAIEQDPLGLAGTDLGGGAALAALGQVRYAAGGLVWQRYEAVSAYGPVVKWAPPEVLHALRIECKYLRYMLEFLREVLGRGTPGLIEEVVALQDQLGALHDADVAMARLRDFLMRHGSTQLEPAARDAVEAYLLTRQRDLRQLIKGAPLAWRKIGGVAFRRRLARAIADM